jgi:hypothetical protein
LRAGFTEYIGQRHEKAANNRNGNTRHEGSTHAGDLEVHFHGRHAKRIAHAEGVTQGAKGPVGNKIIMGGSHDYPVKYPVDINEKGNGCHEDSQQTPDHMPAKGLQMVDETHLGLVRVLPPDLLKKRLPF